MPFPGFPTLTKDKPVPRFGRKASNCNSENVFAPQRP
uniref:Uncharacterized protein n=1 Tax=Arundo donax TaxID=35708 RepID=A0A0A9B155_ARUDO